MYDCKIVTGKTLSSLESNMRIYVQRGFFPDGPIVIDEEKDAWGKKIKIYVVILVCKNQK